MDKEYISPQQCILLLAGFGIGTTLLFVPSILVQFANQSAILSPVLGTVPGIALLLILSSLNRLYPGQSLVQYSASILGLPGKIIGLLFIWFAFHLGVLVLRNIGGFVGLVMLAETPTSVVYCVVVALTAFALLLGLETVSRTLGLLLSLAIFLSVVLMFFTLPHADFSNLLPILENGWTPIVKASVYLTSFPSGEFILIGMLIFNMKGSKETAIPLIQGQLIATMIAIAIILQVITILGAERASRSALAIVSVLNSISSSNLLLIPFAMTWLIFAFAKFFICYYAFVAGFAHWAKMDDYRPLVLPGGALLISIAMILYKDIGQNQEFLKIYWPPYSLPIEYGIPLLLWLAAGVKMLVQRRRSDQG